MKLSDYLTDRNESQEDFAARASQHRGDKIAQRTISRIVNGAGCTAEIARAIILATRDEPTADGGTVTLDDLALGGENASEAA